jgi:hypothetical protein
MMMETGGKLSSNDRLYTINDDYLHRKPYGTFFQFVDFLNAPENTC